MKYIKYLNYVVRHKWYVFLECCKMGIIWQGITHDLSKLLPSELIPYTNYFYGDKKPKRQKTGYYKPTDTGNLAFDFAWLLHQKRNRHHWQWWILPEDDGGIKVLNMPLKYRKEMLCDWRGAGRAQGYGDNTVEWYKKNKDKMQLHWYTREWIEEQLGISNTIQNQ
jgi:hypothetical protein